MPFRIDSADSSKLPPISTYELVVDAEAAGQRLDAWLAGQGLPYSRSQLRRRIEAGEVSIGGQPVKAARKLRAGELVVFAPPPVVEVEDRPEAIPLDVLYEDAHLLVIDKPPGLVVHPATSHQSGTLVNALLHHLGDALPGVGGERRPGIVHRLDKDTSGVIVIAKDEPTLVALQAQFQQHTIERRYLAVVEGVVAEAGTIRSRYGRDPRDRKKFSSKVAGGKRAVTHFRVIERLWGASFIEARLETGRTHQIRVHFRDAGHPVLGDRTYGRLPKEPRVRRVAERLGRQALHAQVLGFDHPRTGERLRLQSQPPPDMMAAIASLRA
jgi:23S rRNA pseudouridine1911/1915/1917 synthase